ncbi:MAG TPA: T9SS type A sorting domain-containing protein [Saprospiraceae bacterium]|nr:T9SS type A sorting domain-containing protein [Saprospiraceae bacterium]
MKILFALLLTVVCLPFYSVAQQAGGLDSTFNGDGVVSIKINNLNSAFFRVRLQPDNKSVAFGYLKQSQVDYKAIVVRFAEDGSLDPVFGTDGVVIIDDMDAAGYDGHVLPDGKILITALDFDDHAIKLIRLLPGGAPDPNFGVNGVAAVDLGLYVVIIDKSILLLPDGKIMVLGTHYDFGAPVVEKNFVAKINPDGTLDSNYGTGGVVIIAQQPNTQDIDIRGGGLQPDGKLVLVGGIGNTVPELQWYLTRLNKDGTIDSTFGVDGAVIKNLGSEYAEGAFDVLVLSDGKIVAGGYAQKPPGFHFTILRLHPDGTADNSFGLGGKAQLSMDCCYSSIFGLVQQPDGKLLACGYGTDNLDYLKFAVARFKQNGIVDQTFGDGGKVIVPLEPSSVSHRAVTMALQPDGKILAAGYGDISDGIFTGVLVRLNPETIVSTNLPEAGTIAHLEAFPNPVTDHSFQLTYQLLETTPLTLSLYDFTGQKIATLIDNEWRPAGENKESLQLPRTVFAGQYLLRLETASGSKTLKITTFE